MGEQPKKIHICIGLLAQVDAGKTTLSEALLYSTGERKILGRVDHGSTFLDTHALERSRGITIFSKQARFQTQTLSVTLLDTPGHVDFSPEAERAMQVLDYAILVISGTDGIQAHTQTLWKLLRRYHIPTFLFFNKMDLPGKGRQALLAQARTLLDPRCVDLEDEDSIALCDEAILETFLDSGHIPVDSLRVLVRKEGMFPCLFGSALRLEGVDNLVQSLEALTFPPSYPADFSARVYKISRDAQGNRLTFLKITGGVLRPRDAVRYSDAEGTALEEKVTQLRLYSGASYTQTEEAVAGTICGVVGLSATRAGDCLGASEGAVSGLMCPVMRYQVSLPQGLDPRLALPKLKQLEEEEPQLRILWDSQTRAIHAHLMGQVQLEVLQQLVKERFDFEITFDSGRVSYRETIAAPVEGVGHFEPLRHYAEVHLLLEPLPRGSGLQFATTCSEDTLDRNWQRLILTHLAEKDHRGVLTGAPITDIRLTLAAGRAHLKHTEGGDFRQATYRAVRQGLMQAESILLEPYYCFHLTVPREQIGRAINDIRAMGGTLASPEEVADGMCLTGNAPVSELQDYMSQVVSYTRGRGRLICELSGYAPCHNTAAVLAEMHYDPEADLENTPDSVFCAHGGGFPVKWNEVFSHMHLESVLRPTADGTSVPQAVRRQNLDLDEKALQEIMAREFGPEKYSLHRPPPRAESSEITLPPPKKRYLIIDGYNMIFAWDGLREQAATDLAGARERLLDILSNFCGYRPCTMVVVFDSYRVKGGSGSKTKHANLRIVYTKENESADLYIETLVGQIGKNYTVQVATSDNMIQLSALRSGVLRLSASELLHEIEQVNEQIAQVIFQLREEARRASIQENPLRAIGRKPDQT